MEFQMDVLEILFRAYERNNDPRRLLEVESQFEIVKDAINEHSDPPPSQRLLARFAKFENEFTVRKILNGVRRPAQPLIATQAYQNILKDQPPPPPPPQTNLVSKMTSWLFS